MSTRTTTLCAGAPIAIVVLGKMFGGALYGLLPLGICVSSGIFFVRAGRVTEWSSKKQRGQTVSLHLHMPEQAVDRPVGYCESYSRICGMNEHISKRHVGSDRP